jgi:hypothetical protein
VKVTRSPCPAVRPVPPFVWRRVRAEAHSVVLRV